MCINYKQYKKLYLNFFFLAEMQTFWIYVTHPFSAYTKKLVWNWNLHLKFSNTIKFNIVVCARILRVLYIFATPYTFLVIRRIDFALAHRYWESINNSITKGTSAAKPNKKHPPEKTDLGSYQILIFSEYIIIYDIHFLLFSKIQ